MAEIFGIVPESIRREVVGRVESANGFSNRDVRGIVTGTDYDLSQLYVLLGSVGQLNDFLTESDRNLTIPDLFESLHSLQSESEIKKIHEVYFGDVVQHVRKEDRRYLFGEAYFEPTLTGYDFTKPVKGATGIWTPATIAFGDRWSIMTGEEASTKLGLIRLFDAATRQFRQRHPEFGLERN